MVRCFYLYLYFYHPNPNKKLDFIFILISILTLLLLLIYFFLNRISCSAANLDHFFVRALTTCARPLRQFVYVDFVHLPTKDLV